MSLRPFTAEELIRQFDDMFEVEFTFLDSARLAQLLLSRPDDEQWLMVSWARRIASIQIPLAYEFIVNVLEQFPEIDPELVESWAEHAMDAYDRSGVQAAMAVVRDVERFFEYSRELAHGITLQEHEGVLLHFVHGLSGRKLGLSSADTTWTDSETIYLPSILAALEDRQENFQLYKVMLAFHWAQTRFGTFRLDMQSLAQLPEAVMQRFLHIERMRLESRLHQELPGLARHMVSFKGRLNEQEEQTAWKEVKRLVSDTKATAETSLEQAKLNTALPTLKKALYQGELYPEKILAVKSSRIEREKARFRVSLKELCSEQENQAGEDRPERFNIREIPDPTTPEGMRFELELNEKPIAPPENVKQLMSSIILDFGGIPPDYLVAAGDGEYDAGLLHDHEPDPDAVWQGTYHEEGAHLYDEWDQGRQHYRKRWCAVREKTVEPVYDDFVRKTLNKHGALVKQLRRSFEAMLDEDRLLKRQVHGDDVDIDALVEALADSLDGSEMSDRLFSRMHRSERNIAVLFMVDMSGSTKGWINDAEREALLLLCEAFELLGDRYAIYGFSGNTRKRCDLFRIKSFDEDYNHEIRARISGIRPQDYTRMGASIRHLSKLLNEVEARTKLLITLSDGKPDDIDHYRGVYGIEDTRKALIEAKHAGIHPFCITIDEEARDYLPHMYGAVNYTLVDNVQQLPMKVSDIYRKLTT